MTPVLLAICTLDLQKIDLANPNDPYALTLFFTTRELVVAAASSHSLRPRLLPAPSVGLKYQTEARLLHLDSYRRTSNLQRSRHAIPRLFTMPHRLGIAASAPWTPAGRRVPTRITLLTSRPGPQLTLAECSANCRLLNRTPAGRQAPTWITLPILVYTVLMLHQNLQYNFKLN